MPQRLQRLNLEMRFVRHKVIAETTERALIIAYKDAVVFHFLDAFKLARHILASFACSVDSLLRQQLQKFLTRCGIDPAETASTVIELAMAQSILVWTGPPPAISIRQHAGDSNAKFISVILRFSCRPRVLIRK